MAAPKSARELQKPRTRFVPGLLEDSSDIVPSLPAAVAAWIPVIQGAAPFSLATFTTAVLQHQVLHPEHASSVILRADVLADEQAQDDEQRKAFPRVDGMQLVRRIRRKLVPKQTRDASMEQECCFYENERDGVVLLLPDLDLIAKHNHSKMPYYHPQVAALAFRYQSPKVSSADSSATIHLDVLPLDSAPLSNPLPLDHRIYRTALALMTSLFSVATGIDEGYEKRVHHDLLTDKNEVQNLYRELKERYRADLESNVHDGRITFSFLLNDWAEVTDPAKHVWEDVACAAWLMVLWREMYKDGRPPGGFVDFGCGNGLLVYILAREGYAGFGFDLRARKSWKHYSPPPDLRTLSLEPPAILSAPPDQSPFPADSFFIGNHADELTPWLPLFAAHTPGVAFLSIPCCAHEHAERFTRKDYKIPEAFLAALPSPPSKVADTDSSKGRHPLLVPFYAPAPTFTGRAHAYQLYLAHITLMCGFLPEREALRMPSTKNFGMLGRKRLWDLADLSEAERAEAEAGVKVYVARTVEDVRGKWVARTPEGKAGEH